MDRISEDRRAAGRRGLRAFLIPYFIVAGAAGGMAGQAVGRLCVTTEVISAALDSRLQAWFVYGTSAIGLMTAVLLAEMLLQLWLRLYALVSSAPALDRAVGAVGLTLGVLLGSAVCVPFAVAGAGEAATIFRPFLMVGLIGLFGVVGLLFAFGLREELSRSLSIPRQPRSGIAREPSHHHSQHADRGTEACAPKLLDTNVIIDGRIASICQTGFVEGKLYVPEFVLAELQHIADSADVLRRRRGRRGLVMLSKMQKEFGTRVAVLENLSADLPDTEEVDIRLVHLAKNMGASVLTNDFNLTKVAELHGVPVMNVNELANSLKPVYLHGEELAVTIVKEGREPGQGVAYLEDGTMVVVEGAAPHVNREVTAVVTSMIQTVAGKMIFAALTDGENDGVQRGRSGPRSRSG